MATRGGGDSDCAMVVHPEGIVDVEIVIGDVKEHVDELLVKVGVCWFRNRFEGIGTNCGV